MHRTTIIGFVAILLLIAGGSAWYLVSTSKSSLNTPAGPATTTDAVFTGDAIYTNGPYGFVIQYPESATVLNTFEPYPGLTPTWRVHALPNATGTPIVSFVTYSTKSESSYPRYFDTMIRIGASTHPKEVSACLKAQPSKGETPLPDVAFGGAIWKTFAFQSDTATQYVKGVSYRTVHEGRCVALEKIAVGSSAGTQSSGDITEAEQGAQYASLERIVQSFLFVRP